MAHTLLLAHDLLSCLRSFSMSYLFYLLVFFTAVSVLLVTLKRYSALNLPHMNRQPSMTVQPDPHVYIVPSNVTLSLSPTLKIRPERLDTHINPNIYMSVLTVPKHHPTRFALQLLTWMQTFNPKQVNHVYSYSFIVGLLACIHGTYQLMCVCLDYGRIQIKGSRWIFKMTETILEYKKCVR